MPTVFGSSSARIALCAPAAPGVTVTVSDAEPFLSKDRLVVPAGSENVPSLPIQLRLNVLLPPSLRVKV